MFSPTYHFMRATTTRSGGKAPEPMAERMDLMDGPNPGNPCTFEATADKTAAPWVDAGERDDLALSAATTNEKTPPEELTSGECLERVIGIEPKTFSLGS